MMENVTPKYILSIARCEIIETSSFVLPVFLLLFVGYDKSSKIGCNREK